MSPPRTSPLVFATALLWSVAYAAWTAGWMLEPMPYALERALRRIPVCIFGAVLCLGIGRVLVAWRGRGARRMVMAGVLVLVATLVHAVTSEWVFYILVPRWGGTAWWHIPSTMMSDFWVYAAWVLLFFAFTADAERRDREVRLARASAEAIDAQHRLLVQQLNPHFLFNALNTVYALVLDSDLPRAKHSVLALSAFLRRSLEPDAPIRVPLRHELESAHHYLDIEMVRFGDRLRLVERVSEATLGREVPALILQPLLENCVKHGLKGHPGTVTITLSASLEEGALVLEVANDGGAPAAATIRNGVGLDHVQRRLRLLYGDAGRLSVGPREGGFVARIRLEERAA